MGIIDQLKTELLCGQNPYSKTSGATDDGYPHTNLGCELIESILREYRPEFWLEIGSMVGGSAIRVASIAENLGLATEVVCIDPFIGDVKMWLQERELTERVEWRFLAMNEGAPTIHERFLANVKSSGLGHRILPLRVTSLVGLEVLGELHSSGRLSSRPSVIYLDAGHLTGETLLEVKACWKLLDSPGLLLGDDWDWPSVRHDVVSFSTESAADCGVYGNHWGAIKKAPAASLIA